MKKIKLLLALAGILLSSITATAQQLPQFSFNDYEGWTYTGGEITAQSFSTGIALYLTSQGNLLTLTSPDFSCQGMDSVAIVIRWASNDMEVGVTAVIDDGQGTPCDSVRCLPTTTASLQKLTCSLPVPHGAAMARLRFHSREADVNNCGFIRKIELTPVIGEPSGDDPVVGDVDGDGKVSIADVSALIDILLNGDTIDTPSPADVDQDGNVNIADVSALIDRLLSGD